MGLSGGYSSCCPHTLCVEVLLSEDMRGDHEACAQNK